MVTGQQELKKPQKCRRAGTKSIGLMIKRT